MADDWDADDFVPKAPKGVIKDNWDDEEVEEVKESWDDDDTPKTAPKKQVEKKKEAPATVKSVIVAEMTEEEKKRAQEEADMVHATELFGISKSLDEVSLNSREECIDYTNRLYAKLNKFHNKSCYQEFIEELLKSLCKNVPADTVRKISNSFKAFSDNKSAVEKAAKQADAKTKPKSKATIKPIKNEIKGNIDDFLKDNYTGGDFDEEYDEDNDFM